MHNSFKVGMQGLRNNYDFKTYIAKILHVSHPAQHGKEASPSPESKAMNGSAKTELCNQIS